MPAGQWAWTARGRKQYRYHSQWRMEREQTKFEPILYFGEKLPAIRKQVEKDMELRGLALLHNRLAAVQK